MNSFVKITLLRRSLSQTDSPFCKISERTGPNEVEVIYDQISAWQLLNHPEKDNVLSVEFTSEDKYLQHHALLTS